MMTAVDCVPKKSDLDILTNRFLRMRDLQHGYTLYRFFKVFKLSIRNHFEIRQLVASIRGMLNRCAVECTEQCLKDIQNAIVPLRDMQLDFIKNEPESLPYYNWIYRPTRGLIKKNLFLLDELVEDCEVGSDEEFRRLVKQVAEKC